MTTGPASVTRKSARGASHHQSQPGKHAGERKDEHDAAELRRSAGSPASRASRRWRPDGCSAAAGVDASAGKN